MQRAVRRLPAKSPTVGARPLRVAPRAPEIREFPLR